jgi:cellular nucleic acid-binding protein
LFASSKKLGTNMAQPSQTNIYILRLEGGKYYIGKSNNPMKRYEEHLRGEGSAWTKKYRPVGVERIVSNTSSFDEDKYTKEYMSKYGIENVRGGSYCEIKLDDFQIEALQVEIWGANNKCKRCGRSGHFVKDCYATFDVNGYRIDGDSDSSGSESDSDYDSDDIVWACGKCDKEFSDEETCDRHEHHCRGNYMVISQQDNSFRCYCCGKTGHYARNCPQSYDSN